jgi:hypothetical protein
MSVLSKTANADIIQQILSELAADLPALLAAAVEEYKYTPRDPPHKRREIMTRLVEPSNENLFRLIIFTLLRGGNPTKSMKNLSERTVLGIQTVMKFLKVKGFTPAGLYSSWQYMTSFWEYSVLVMMGSRKIQKQHFVVGSVVYKNYLPLVAYVTGGLHLFKGITDPEKAMVKNEIFRHQHFLIFTKNSLDPKKRANNADKPEYLENRQAQTTYLDYQMSDDTNNFPTVQVQIVRSEINFDIVKVMANLKQFAVNDKNDYILSPYNAPAQAYCQGYNLEFEEKV